VAVVCKCKSQKDTNLRNNTSGTCKVAAEKMDKVTLKLQTDGCKRSKKKQNTDVPL
jgi:hypothetical protein